ncbi:MAG: hypothetical protein N2Z22_05680, partial [Turneriella sp.]|nr:hypothetical protein [Turneriella sp.]
MRYRILAAVWILIAFGCKSWGYFWEVKDKAPQGTGPSGFTVGGTVSGLSGILVLQNNGGDNLTLNSNGSFVFATSLPTGAVYDVTVLANPAGQVCHVRDNQGTIA